ncbi:restriction endonuclease [Klebsiella michiganensis]|uniref:McrC family protein n=1 Tax=Klebsiella michiganensis TaxID=1134687 RepID=UPI00111A601E|nr:restriction endonuclease [Klebsiella michiganensis]ELC0837205.1 restriction endonuclease [Klebsiella michiganensis]ELF4771105.1 restriction endonuclease [Klebsiella michiganensis]ELP0294327.1 restriction endonuclease [Klebsiella michiganensis]MBK4128424.1 restriction endonuclease [Klebsiella michiganensis]MCW9515052.1 restriction endonuclease [Klebsiella michiganensis]
MAGSIHTIFEYGYLISEEDHGKLADAESLPAASFRWLEQRCLRDKESEEQRLLSLRAIGGVKVIQVKNYVGVIALPQQRLIEILPKTGKLRDDISHARRRLLMMLETLNSFRHMATTTANIMTSRMTLMDIFIQQFVTSMETIVRRGLKYDYLRQRDNLPWLRGKLLTSEQLKKNSVHRDRFYVEYDEYRIERPENRLLKTAIDKVYGYTTNPLLLQALNRLQELFDTIPKVDNVDIAFRQVHLDRHMQYYELPLNWAKLILQGNSPHCMQGHAEAISLLFPMEAVFEAFVTAWLRQYCHTHWQVKPQSKSHYLAQYGTSPMFQLRPDIWLIPRNRPEQSSVICDMKWKLIDTNNNKFNLTQSDLYQMLAYGVNHMQGSGDMLLIYPRHEGFQAPLEHPFEFNHSGGKTLRLWVVPFEAGTSLQTSRLLMPAKFSLTDCGTSPFLPLQ